jgi:hypothetical protein
MGHARLVRFLRDREGSQGERRRASRRLDDRVGGAVDEHATTQAREQEASDGRRDQ